MTMLYLLDCATSRNINKGYTIIDNLPSEEQVATRNFLCYLYWESRDRSGVHENCMKEGVL